MAKPVRDKRSRLQRADDLVRLGSRLMAQAEAGAGLRPREQARLYRDGLMIACLALPAAAAGQLHRPRARPAAPAARQRLVARDPGGGDQDPPSDLPALPRAAGAGPGERISPIGGRSWPRPARPAPCPALWLTEQNRGISADPCPSADHPPHRGGVRPARSIRTASAMPWRPPWRSPRPSRSAS